MAVFEAVAAAHGHAPAASALSLFPVGRVIRGSIAIKALSFLALLLKAFYLALSHPQVLLQRPNSEVFFIEVLLECLLFPLKIFVRLTKRLKFSSLGVSRFQPLLQGFDLALGFQVALFVNLEAFFLAFDLLAVLAQQMDLFKLLFLRLEVLEVCPSFVAFVTEQVKDVLEGLGAYSEELV